MENLSVADVAAVTGRGYDNNGFGGQGLWLFAILALMGGGFGNWNNRGSAATAEDVASGFNFSALQNKTNELGRDITSVNQNLSNAICNLGYQTGRDFANLSQQLANCCCETQLGIKDIKFDMANYNAATNALIVSQNQRILDALKDNEIAALRGEIHDLKLDKALCGVLRYPTTMTIPAVCNPFTGQTQG